VHDAREMRDYMLKM